MLREDNRVILVLSARRHIFAVSLLLITMMCSTMSAASIINSSFELETDGLMANGTSTALYEEWGIPDGWTWRNSGPTNGHGMRSDFTGTGNQIHWSSDGNWALYLFAATQPPDDHFPGQFIEFYQSVDLTGQANLLFDAMLKGGTYTNSYLAIDSQKLWIDNQPGTYLDNLIDVSGFAGVHEIQLGIEVFQTFGNSADGWTYFDNLRLIPEPDALLIVLLGLGMMVLSRQRGRRFGQP
jgi:hypothetical protein